MAANKPSGWVTPAEARAIKAPVSKFRKANSRLGWPLVPMEIWDMGVSDPQTNNPDEALPDIARGGVEIGKISPYKIKYHKVIMCRLLQNQYSHAQATARCTEIHGSAFDGAYRSGRYWVFWKKGVV